MLTASAFVITGAVTAYHAVKLAAMLAESNHYYLETKAKVRELDRRSKLIDQIKVFDRETAEELYAEAQLIAVSHQAKVDQWMALVDDIKRRQRHTAVWLLTTVALVTVWRMNG
jgi:hypothetical protein